MIIKSWGRFSAYTPETADVAHLQAEGVVFSRNEDGVDFYALRKQFAAGSIIASVNDEGQIVAAGYSPDGMHPFHNMRLVELSGPDLPSVLQEIVGKTIDFETSSLLIRPKQLRTSLYKTEIYERMSDGELDILDEALEGADRRTRLMWRDCLEVMVDSPLFPILQAQMTVAFGEDRAEAILSLKP